VLNDLKSALFLAYKYVTRGNKGIVILTIFMATLAFIQINIVTGILSGAVGLVYYQTKNNYVGNIVIQPGKDQWGNAEKYIKQVTALKRKINEIPGIIGCSARYATGSVIEYDPDKTGKDVRTISWPVKSINPEDEKRISELHNHMLAGEYLDESDRDQIIMGREITGGYGASLEVQSLKGVNIGDEVTVFYHNGVTRKYTIKGIYATVFPLADMTIFVTQKEMESVLGLHDRASEIIIRTDEAYSEEYYIQELRNAGVELQDIRPWQDFIGLVFSLVQTFDIIKRIILVIGLIVAGVTIFIVIFIATISRKKQIGIMKAIGMKEGIIVASYIMLALFYAIVGIGIGIALIELVATPYFIAHPLNFPMGKVSLMIIRSEFLTSIISMLAVSIIAGFIPSWQVSRENIIKAIWG
jgi:putative ABC transport system permease protein